MLLASQFTGYITSNMWASIVTFIHNTMQIIISLWVRRCGKGLGAAGYSKLVEAGRLTNILFIFSERLDASRMWYGLLWLTDYVDFLNEKNYCFVCVFVCVCGTWLLAQWMVACVVAIIIVTVAKGIAIEPLFCTKNTCYHTCIVSLQFPLTSLCMPASIPDRGVRCMGEMSAVYSPPPAVVSTSETGLLRG